MKLLIRNLARSTTDAEIREMFESYGAVQSCTIVMDAKTGVSKGFGFVEMPKPGEAKAAMKAFNNQEIAGNKIRVKKAEQKTNEPTSAEVTPTQPQPTVAEKPLPPKNPWKKYE